MTQKKRVALTIFVDEDFWKEAKERFGRGRDQSFQRVGEALFRAWGMQGMPLDAFDIKLPNTNDPVIDKCVEILANPSTESSLPLERAAGSLAGALKSTVELLLRGGGA